MDICLNDVNIWILAPTEVAHYNKYYLSLYPVFHGIRLLRLIKKIDCRETINLFCPS